MANYVTNTMVSGERVLLTAKTSLRKYWFRFFLALIIAVAAATTVMMGVATDAALFFRLAGGYAVLILLLIAGPIIRHFTNELTLTNKRIVAKIGLFSTSTIEISLDRIEGLRVQQSIFGRILNYGTIVVIGVGGSQEPIPNIVAPIMFRTNFAAALENLKGPRSPNETLGPRL